MQIQKLNYLLKLHHFNTSMFKSSLKQKLHLNVCVGGGVGWGGNRVTSSCPMFDKGFTSMLLNCQNNLKVHVCTVSFLNDLRSTHMFIFL